MLAIVENHRQTLAQPPGAGLPTGSNGRSSWCENLLMTDASNIPDGFVAGLEGVVAFTTQIAEPDKDGGACVIAADVEELVAAGVTFGDVWSLLVDGAFGRGLTPAEPFPLPIHTGDVRVDVQAGLAMLAPIWGYEPCSTSTTKVPATSWACVAGDARCPHCRRSRPVRYPPPAVGQRTIDECSTVTGRFMTRWKGDPDPRHVEAIDAYWVTAAEHGMNASTFTRSFRLRDVAASLLGPSVP